MSSKFPHPHEMLKADEHKMKQPRLQLKQIHSEITRNKPINTVQELYCWIRCFNRTSIRHENERHLSSTYAEQCYYTNFIRQILCSNSTTEKWSHSHM